MTAIISKSHQIQNQSSGSTTNVSHALTSEVVTSHWSITAFYSWALLASSVDYCFSLKFKCLWCPLYASFIVMGSVLLLRWWYCGLHDAVKGYRAHPRGWSVCDPGTLPKPCAHESVGLNEMCIAQMQPLMFRSINALRFIAQLSH